ncbi:MAG: flavodoxin family protein [Chloroflexi bacterium]|nr:flavodoxin family protein [Chloroflexota bacterium]
MVNILGISCSPRRRGNTEILIGEALAGAREAGAETELLTLHDKDIRPCDGCFTCTKTGECKIDDDMQSIYDKLLAADGIIFGTPVYFWSASAQAKILLDRALALRYPHLRLANKVGGIIAIAERTGLMNTAMLLYTYFARNHMLASDEVCALAAEKGEVRQDKYAMKASWELGGLVVALARTGFQYPQEYNTPLYTRVNRKYGIKFGAVMPSAE